MKYEHIQQEAYAANMELPQLGLVLFTFGNVSAADRSLGVFAIKPSGVAYEDLTPAKMVIVDFDGNTVEGNLRPSSDTQTHAVLYKQWDTIGGVVLHILLMQLPGPRANWTYLFTEPPMQIIIQLIFPVLPR